MKWLFRMAMITVGVGLLAALTVLVHPLPLPWAALIPASVPLLVAVFVIIPMIRGETPSPKPPIGTKWLVRMAAILVGVGVADAVAVLVLPHPMPWAGLIPAFTPLLTAVFVIIPMNQARRRFPRPS